MDTKTVLIICTLMILVAIISCGVVIANSLSENTIISVDLSEINQGDGLTISLTDSNGQPLVNKVVHVTINGVTYNLTTDSVGKTQLPINLNPNDYVISIKFDGESFKYKSSEITQPLKVLDNSSSSSQSTASSTTSSTTSSSSTSNQPTRNEDGSIDYQGQHFSNYGDFRAYRDSSGSSYYARHSSWDDDGDGYISGLEHNRHGVSA